MIQIGRLADLAPFTPQAFVPKRVNWELLKVLLINADVLIESDSATLPNDPVSYAQGPLQLLPAFILSVHPQVLRRKSASKHRHIKVFTKRVEYVYNESPKVVTSPKVVAPIASVYSMRSAGLSQLPGENSGLFHRFEMRRSVKLINSALDVGPASFFVSGDQIPLGKEKHCDLDNPANFMTCQTVIV
jgi:hypothetical protein